MGPGGRILVGKGAGWVISPQDSSIPWDVPGDSDSVCVVWLHWLKEEHMALLVMHLFASDAACI